MKNRRERAVVVERVIAAPAGAIFDVLADPNKHRLIDGADAVRQPSTSSVPRLTAGATFVMRMRLRPERLDPAQLLQVLVALASRGRLTNRVVEFEDGRRIAWRNFGRHVWRYELEPAAQPGATVVRETFDYSTNTFPLLLELVRFPERNRESMQATLARLAALVEM